MGKRKGESRGLAYLQETRPEAIRHLLRFFRESGRHLEARTRFLISVVTKVINFSPRGLEQYVRRALEEGATPNEIIDAVLLAYPCAGLTRVVDAIDVILDLDLPGFAPEVLGGVGTLGVVSRAGEDSDSGDASGQWLDVAAVDAVPSGGAVCVSPRGREIALIRHGDGFRALDNACPHSRGGTLAAGTVDGDVVSCPFHGWQFNVETGECLDRQGVCVGTYPTRVRGERVELYLPS